MRIWDSGVNRSDGDAPPSYKLALDGAENKAERTALLRDSAADPEQAGDWLAASGNNGDRRVWSTARALAFQAAVEKRAFQLYRRFYE